jgi:hypothetical protein
LKLKGDPVPWPKGQELSEEHKAKLTSRKPPPPIAVEWLPFLQRSLEKAFRYGKPPRVAQETFLDLAGRLAMFGPPSDPQALIVFEHLSNLLFCPCRLDFRKGDSLRKHVDLLPTTREGLNRVVAAVMVAQKQLGSFADQSFPVGNFITVALQIPSARWVEVYIKRVLESGLRVKTVSSIFSPNVFAFTEKDLRAMDPYGRKDLPKVSPEHEAYWEQNAAGIAKIETIDCGPKLSPEEQEAIFAAQIAKIPCVR